MQLGGKAEEFIREHVETIRPLLKESGLAWWNACLSGKEEDYKKYSDFEFKLKEIYKDKENFEKVKSFKNKIKDPILNRQINLLYLYYLENQADSELLRKITDKSTEIEKKFNTFRGKIDNKKVTNNEIENILENEKDNNLRKKAWEASQQVGEVVSNDLIELVKLRNKVAKENGFNDYYEMSSFIQEQNKRDLIALLDKVERLTKNSYKKLKKEIDYVLKKKYNTDKIFPWHYVDPFFQSLPKFYEIDLDKYYKDKDVLEVTKEFYKSIDFDISNILDRSDLYERPKKNPHAYCIIIDRETKDIRVLMNLKNNYKWMSTSLHEFGHGIYFENVGPKLPFLLKRYSHGLITEGVSEMFGNLVRDPAWIEDTLKVKLSNQEKVEIKKILIAENLVFLRWVLVMFHFEKSLYENPDQDLNNLWWDLKEKYQLENKPEERDKPDYAAKIHLVSSPVYYHNYLLGRFFSAQLQNYVIRNIFNNNEGFQNNKEFGGYLREKVFKPGLLYDWNSLIEYATGEKLKVDYLIEQLTF